MFRNFIKNRSLGLQWYLHLTGIAYVFLVFIMIPRHEPWADEAQAWLIARDSSVFDLLFKNLRYEGSPGLWHLILMVPSRIINYQYFGYISAFFGIAGIYLILYKSPFPVWMKILLPFTYYLFFQYVIVSRCYVLFLVLLPLIAFYYNKKFRKPILYGALLIVLANINLHGFIMSLVLSLFFLLKALFRRNEIIRYRHKQFLLILFFILMNAVFVIIQIRPAPDISFSSKGFTIDFYYLTDLTHQILQHLFSDTPALSYLIICISLFWFWRKKVLLLYLILTIPILVLFSIYYNIWHQGVLILIWLFCIWIGFDKSNHNLIQKSIDKTADWLMYTAILTSLIFQIYWNYTVSYNDYNNDFSAGKKIAEYIKANNLEDKKICATQFWSICVLPYFDHNIYQSPEYESGKAFWVWKTANDYSESPDKIIAKQPDFIIFSRPNMFWYPDSVKGYREVKITKGTVFWKDTIKEVNDFRFFRKEE